MTTRLESRIPAYLSIRTPRPIIGQQAPSTPAAATGPKLMAFVFFTWNGSNPTSTSIADLTASPHIRGYNYDTVWKPFFQNRGLTVGRWSTTNPDTGTAHVWEYSRRNSDGALVNEGTANSTKYVQLRGMAIPHFASAHDYFCAGHGYPAGLVTLIRSLSTVGTKCGVGLLNFESVNQGVQFNPHLEALRIIARGYALSATATDCGNPEAQPNLNTYRCSCIDQYETSGLIGSICVGSYPANLVACPHTPTHASLPENSPLGLNTKHTWEIDVRSRDWVADLLAGLFAFDALEEHDFKLFDNCKEDPYRGAATTQYPAGYDSTAYRGTRSASPAERVGWKGFNQGLQEQYATKPADYLWHNTYNFGTSVYSAQDVRNRWCEAFFTVVGGGTSLDTLVNLKARILAAQQAGCVICLNAQYDGNASAWTQSPGPGGVNGTWAELFGYIDAINAWSNVVVMTGRDSNGMFHQTGMRIPV